MLTEVRCPRFPYCHQVINVQKTDSSNETIDADSKVYSCEARLAALEVSCRWLGINKETCGALSHYDRPKNCQGCTNICWLGYSSVSYERPGGRNKPEAGGCESAKTIPPLSSEVSQTTTTTLTDDSSLNPSGGYETTHDGTKPEPGGWESTTPSLIQTSEQPWTGTSVTTEASSPPSSTAYVYATTTADNSGTSEADVGSSNDNEDVLIGLAVGLGLFVVLTIALVIVLTTIIYRRRKQTRDKEREADNRSTSRDHENDNHLPPSVGNQLYFRREESDVRTSGLPGNVNSDMGEMIMTTEQSPPDGDTEESDVGELNTPRTPGDDNTLYLGGDHTYTGYSIADEGGYVMYDPPMANQENQLRKVYDEIAEDNGNEPHQDHVTKAVDSPTMTPGNDPQSLDYVMPELDGAADHRVARTDSHDNGDRIQDERHVDREFEFLDRHVYHEIPGEGGEASYENLSQAVSYAAT